MANYCITLFGGKGGVGTTVSAVNLATVLTRDTQSKVLLLDLDLMNCGDLGLSLGAKEVRPIVDLLPVAHKLHEKSVEGYITRHKSGIWILPAITELHQADKLAIDKFAQLLAVLRKAFSFIIIDAGAHLHAANLEALKVSSAVLMVVTPQILVIQQAMARIREIAGVQYPQELIQVLINRADPNSPINESVIQSKLKRKLLGALPDNPEEVTFSIHQNIPLVLQQPRSTYTKAMEQISNLIFSSGLLKPLKGLPLNADEIPLFRVGLVDDTDAAKGAKRGDYMKGMNDLEYDRFSDLKMTVHSKLIDMLNLKGINTADLASKPEKLAELKEQVRDAVATIVQDTSGIQSIEERQKISKEVLDEALGLGPLEDILADSAVSEIMVNRKDQIYVEKSGKLYLTAARFTSDRHLQAVIERIIAPIGRRIDEKTPMVDARLKDGSRVHAIIPPLSIQGPMLTIRKFGRNVVSHKDLVKLGAMTEEMALFLKCCVEARLNIIISGGTGTGKTTLLNILGAFIPSTERIITVEDAAELQLPQEHVGRLEARPANLQGDGAIPIRELVRNTLRMRPDRIIIGECRGAEALDMLQAMNTGHDGSLTTLHSNNPRDCIARLETLVMFSGMELPSKAIREQISSAINLIIQLTRFSDGTRKITYITEVTGMEGPTVTTQDIFLYRQKGVDAGGKVAGNFAPTGLIPSFMERFKEIGVKVPTGLFGEPGGKSRA